MKYYAYHPRRFANEYTVIRVEETGDKTRLWNWFNQHAPDGADMRRVTVRELRQMRADERRRRRDDPNFSGYCNPFKTVAVSDFLPTAAK